MMPRQVVRALRLYADQVQATQPEVAERLRRQANGLALRRDDAREAEPKANPALRHFGNDNVSKALYATAMQRLEAGEHLVALALLQKIHALHPDAYRPVNFALGELYADEDIRTIPRDYGQALHHFEQAANQGCARSQLYLLHHPGLSVTPEQWFAWGEHSFRGENHWPQDNAAALRCFEKSADAGHAEAAFLCGQFHEKGIGTAASPYISLVWYLRAYQLGYTRAAEHIHNLDYWQRQSGQEHLMCTTLFRNSGETSKDIADNFNYWGGRCAPTSYPDAKHWYELAARAGSTEARTHLRYGAERADFAYRNRSSQTSAEEVAFSDNDTQVQTLRERVARGLYDERSNASSKKLAKRNTSFRHWYADINFNGRLPRGNFHSQVDGCSSRAENRLSEHNYHGALMHYQTVLFMLHGRIDSRLMRELYSDALFKIGEIYSERRVRISEGKSHTIVPHRNDLTFAFWQAAARIGHAEAVRRLTELSDLTDGDVALQGLQVLEIGVQAASCGLSLVFFGNCLSNLMVQKYFLEQFKNEPRTQCILRLALIAYAIRQSPKYGLAMMALQFGASATAGFLTRIGDVLFHPRHIEPQDSTYLGWQRFVSGLFERGLRFVLMRSYFWSQALQSEGAKPFIQEIERAKVERAQASIELSNKEDKVTAQKERVAPLQKKYDEESSEVTLAASRRESVWRDYKEQEAILQVLREEPLPDMADDPAVQAATKKSFQAHKKLSQLLDWKALAGSVGGPEEEKIKAAREAAYKAAEALEAERRHFIEQSLVERSTRVDTITTRKKVLSQELKEAQADEDAVRQRRLTTENKLRGPKRELHQLEQEVPPLQQHVTNTEQKVVMKQVALEHYQGEFTSGQHNGGEYLISSATAIATGVRDIATYLSSIGAPGLDRRSIEYIARQLPGDVAPTAYYQAAYDLVRAHDLVAVAREVAAQETAPVPAPDTGPPARVFVANGSSASTVAPEEGHGMRLGGQ